jgi:methyl-accepting chemotaxis protein
MQVLNRFKIGPRLGLAFALSIAVAIGIALYARLVLGQVNDELITMVQDCMAKVERLSQFKDNVAKIAEAARHTVMLTDPAAIRREIETIEDMRRRNIDLLKQLDAMVTLGKGRQLLRQTSEARLAYVASVDRVTALGLKGEHDKGRDLLLNETNATQAHLAGSLNALIGFQKDLMHAAAERADGIVGTASATVLALAGAATVFGTLLALLITRSVVRPIRQAVEAAETVARGDLRVRLDTARRDEAGQLLQALQKMAEGLVAIVGAVRGNADGVATASGQIAQGNADLSQRTEEQAANLQQTAASMEQLTATVSHNTDTARQAAQLAGGAARVAEDGGQVMGQVVDTMEQISASSRRIADIIGTVDAIAFQTNILALNAAVEAARAGEQGRGFAVVAGEVRALAQRSAEAAREIKSLIHASVERVEAGNALVGTAGRTMDEVVVQVWRVSDLIGEISAASEEQSKGIGQIDDAVSQLDQVTQQNAALVEQSAAATESLRAQAGQLAQTVATFKLGTADGGAF